MRERCPACWRTHPPTKPCTCPPRLRRVALLLTLRDACYAIPAQRLPTTPAPAEEPLHESDDERRLRLTKHNTSELGRLERQAAARRGETLGEDAEWLGWQRHHASGNFHELDQALTQMLERPDSAWAAWICHRAYIERLPVAASRDERVAALHELSLYLPAELRVPNNPPTPREQREGRDQRVRRAHEQGQSVTRLAAREQVSVRTIQRIIAEDA